jgi:plasmid stability protein
VGCLVGWLVATIEIRAVRSLDLPLAFCLHRMQTACMSVQITIRNVPEPVRDELAARAALEGRSMQEFLRGELERLAARPSLDRVLERIRARKAAAGTTVSVAEILAARDSDRR